MKAIKSGWGNLANLGSNKKHNQHSKQRDKWEVNKDRAELQDVRDTQKQELKHNKWALKDNEKMIDHTLDQEKKNLRHVKKDDKQELKNIKKGNSELRDGKEVWGGFIFEEVTEGTGDKCQAEKDLEELQVMTSSFVDKARTQASLIDESMKRTEDLESNLEGAHSRSRILNKNMRKYVS